MFWGRASSTCESYRGTETQATRRAYVSHLSPGCAGWSRMLHLREMGWHLLGEFGEGQKLEATPNLPPAPLNLPPPHWSPKETESQGLPVSSSSQALLRTLLTLAAFTTAIAAIYNGAYYFQELSNEFHQALCTSPASWEPTRPPWEPTRPTSSPEEANKQHLCLSYLRQVKVGGQGRGAAQTMLL